jgi:hypothetical protein
MSDEERKALAVLKKSSPAPCGARWHTGCITKYVMTSVASERVLMGNDGNLERISIPDTFGCCKVWLKDLATA